MFMPCPSLQGPSQITPGNWEQSLAFVNRQEHGEVDVYPPPDLAAWHPGQGCPGQIGGPPTIFEYPVAESQSSM